MLSKAFSIVGLAALMAVPAQASTTFDFTGGSNHISVSEDFVSDDITLTVTAGYFNGDSVTEYEYTAAVGHYSTGLGVNYSGSDAHYVDGGTRNDLLIFSFDQTVELESITFSYWDVDRVWVSTGRRSGYWTWVEGDDEFTLFTSDPWTNIGTNYNPDSVGQDGVAMYAFDAGWITDTFGVGAYDDNDEFKVRSLTVKAIESGVPEPATWLMMIMGFGLVGLASRRRSAAVAA